MNTKSIHDYDFLDFLEIKNVSTESRKELDEQTQKLTWGIFLDEYLEDSLSEDEIAMLNKLAQENKSSKDILDIVIQKIPDIKSTLSTITSDVKKEILENYLKEQYEKYNKEQSNTELSPSELEKVIERTEKYLKAGEYFHFEDWENLHKLLTNS